MRRCRTGDHRAAVPVMVDRGDRDLGAAESHDVFGSLCGRAAHGRFPDPPSALGAVAATSRRPERNQRSMSSRLRPLVSGTSLTAYSQPSTQTAAYSQNVTELPRLESSERNVSATRKFIPQLHISDALMAEPRMRSG